MPVKRVLVTGARGLIGGEVYRHLKEFPDQYDVYGLSRRRGSSERVADDRDLQIPEEKFILSDLSDLDQVAHALQGMDVVVHMAADPSGRKGWESVLPSNIVTTDGVAADGAAITAARASVPNATDLVSSPTAAACSACHASEVAEAHIEQNGGIIAEVRSESGL